MEQIDLLLISGQRPLIEKVSTSLAAPENKSTPLHFTICQVDSLAAGATAVASQQFDAALIEIASADAPHLDEIRRLHQRAPHLPLILLGDIEDQELPLRAVQAGAQSYLSASRLDGYWLTHTIQQAIERQQNSETLRQYAQFQAALNAITRLALQPLPFAEMLRQLANQTKALFNCDGCYITLWDESQQLTIPIAASDPLGDLYRMIKPEPNEETLTAVALQTKQIIITEDIFANIDRVPKQARSLPARALLTMPLIAGARKLGAIFIAYNQPHQYTPTEKEQAEQLAQQLSLVIAQTQLLEEEQRQRRLADALRDAAAALTSTLDMRQVVDGILLHLRQVVYFDSACIFLRENDNLRAVAEYGLPYPELVIGHSASLNEDELHKTIAETQRPIILDDAQQDPRFRSWGESGYIRSWIGLPLRARGEIIGHLTLDHKQPATFTAEDAKIALAFADQAAAAMENARLFAAERQRNDELLLLVNVATILRMSNSRQETLSDILSILLTLLSAQGITLILQDLDTKEMVIAHSQGIWAEINNIRTAPKDSIAHQVMQTGEVYLDNNAAGKLDRRLAHAAGADQIKAVVCAPLISEQIRLGAIWVARDKPFSQRDIEPLLTISDMLANALYRDILHERAEREVKERTTELAAANDQLRDLDKLKSKFVADISHELRTPVTNMNLYLHLLEKGQPEKSEHYMTVIKGQVARLNQLVEDILSLTRLDVDRQSITLKRLNLNRLLQSAAAIIQPRLEKRELAFRLNLPAEPLTICGDQSQLQQLFHNLLLNAFNYTPSGQIELGARPSPDKRGIEAWVADSGVGVSPEDLPHIFERFYRGQSEGQSNIPGAGLGLAIVHDVAQIHHARISVSANEMGGATFTILFPYPVEGA
jgi:signal transduction histidine kinase